VYVLYEPSTAPVLPVRSFTSPSQSTSSTSLPATAATTFADAGPMFQ